MIIKVWSFKEGNVCMSGSPAHFISQFMSHPGPVPAWHQATRWPAAWDTRILFIKSGRENLGASLIFDRSCMFCAVWLELELELEQSLGKGNKILLSLAPIPMQTILTPITITHVSRKIVYLFVLQLCLYQAQQYHVPLSECLPQPVPSWLRGYVED